MSVTKGHSTLIKYGDGATAADSTTWTKLAQVTAVTPPKIQADDINVSHMESPNQAKQFTAGWADGGEVEFTIQFKADEADTVYGMFRIDKGWQVVFSDGSMWECDGYIKSYGDETDREGIVTTSITIKVSGLPEFVPAVQSSGT